jgi:ubiquinone/menaquinone biosynthesis C-methylase UbiE
LLKPAAWIDHVAEREAMMRDYDPETVEAHEHGAWEAAARRYSDHVATLTARSGQLAIVEALVSPTRSDYVLDVGCGPGVLTAQLQCVAGEVVGIDFSANMIEEARRQHATLRFAVANAEDLPFDDASFDVAVVNYCAHHLARPVKAFSEIRRVLKPGGRLAVIHPIQSRQPSWRSFADAVADVLPPEVVPGGGLLHVDQPDAYTALLTDCGYKSAACRMREKPVTLDRLGTLLETGWIITVLGSEPQDVQKRIEAGVRQRAQAYRNRDGSYTFPDVVLAARATA